MIRLTKVSNVWTRVCDQESLTQVRKFLSYTKARWITIGGRKQVRNITRNFCSGKGWFFTGFIPLIEANFDEVYVNDERRNRKEYQIQMKESEAITLYLHQRESLETAMQYKRGVIKSPTGSGKTFIEASLFSVNDYWKGLLLVHTKSLLYQLRDNLQKYLGEEVGVVGDGEEDWKRITVAMVQTLSTYEKQSLRDLNIDIVVVDECHHAIAKTYSFILSQIDCEYRFGLSATPKDFEDEKSEYLTVIGTLGPIIKAVEYEEVEHLLALPEVRMLKYRDRYDIPSGASWQYAYKLGVEENQERNEKIAEAVRELEGSTLILVKTIRHGEELKSHLPGAKFVCGLDKTETRERIKRYLGGEGHRVVVATGVFGEGVDIPALDNIINAGAGKSRIQTIQRAGRALRKAEGKKRGVIIDFWDESTRYVENHSNDRYDTYKKLGWI